MNRVDLKPVVSLAGLDATHVSGTASLSASAKGELSKVAESRAFINLQDIQAAVADVPIRLALPSRLSWDGTALNIDSLDVSIGGGKLHASGRLSPEGGVETAKWQSTFAGELGDLIKIGRPYGVPSELEGAGPVNIVWESTGGLEKSTATVRLANGSLAWGALPAIRDLALDANFDGATLNVARLTGIWQDGGIEGTASIPRAVLEARETGGPNLPPGQAGFAKLRVIGLSEAALAPWLSPTVLKSINGRVSATLDARINRPSIEGVAGTMTFDEADFTLAGVKVTQISPAILYLEGGLVTLRDVSFNAGGSPLTVTGTAVLAPTDKQTLDLEVAGTVDLQIISAFAPTIVTDGDAKLNVGIGGPLRAPVFNGRIDVAGAELALREPRVVVAELNGTIALDGQRVLFDSLRGSLNGGLLTLDGGFLLEGFVPNRGGLTIVVDNAALEYPEDLQSEADALVTLTPGPTGWTLTGDINVERSVYNEPISLPALIAARRSRVVTAPGEESWGERLRLNLFASTLQDLRIDNNYGRIEAGAALRVLGTVSEPVLSGRVTLREGGEVYLAGNTFHISRGSISFTNP
ncbi:MAG: translocation/assembly module TamB domain-containing protein, partial [Vicinamibacterales bacterium]